ncbi:MAG: aminotransferase class I/II-fold pyridoxal phosphate-dependent enzyme, partial [Chloroflexota bacterium]
MDFDRYLSQRARRVGGSLGKQTSVPILGLINLGSGTPDFLPPPHVFEAMKDALGQGRAQYTAWTGIPELRA